MLSECKVFFIIFESEFIGFKVYCNIKGFNWLILHEMGIGLGFSGQVYFLLGVGAALEEINFHKVAIPFSKAYRVH